MTEPDLLLKLLAVIFGALLGVGVAGGLIVIAIEQVRTRCQNAEYARAAYVREDRRRPQPQEAPHA